MSTTTKKTSSGLLEPTGHSSLSSLLLAPSASSSSSSSSSSASHSRPLIAEVAAVNDEGSAQQVETERVRESAISLQHSLQSDSLTAAATVPIALSPRPTAPSAADEGPSMFELMMEEQRRAAGVTKEKVKEKEKEKTDSKKGSGGFKKGFFGGASSSGAGKSTKKSNPSEIIEVKAKPATAIESSKDKLVLNEVQQKMEEENPLLKSLKNQEWITPDLTTQFQKNPILAAGFHNPKCLAAIELLQKNPSDAMKRFKDDPDVSLFLQEFGKVMSKHFESLGAQQSSQQPQTNAKEKAIEEIGPLQAKALQRQKINASETTIEPAKPSIASKPMSSDKAEEARVQQILNDVELREMLMDPNLQKILMECGDPAKLREHMKNPAIVAKIKKLRDAGLVKMEL